MDANSPRVFWIRKSQAKKKEDSPDKLSLGSLPRVKRAEVLENVLAAGIPLRKIDHLRGLLEAGGQHLTKSSGISELFPTIHAMAKKDLLDLRLAQPDASGVSTCTMPGTTTPSSSMVLPVKAKLSPSLFASSTNSWRLFNALSGSTSLPSPLQALSYRRYYKMKACSRISKY